MGTVSAEARVRAPAELKDEVAVPPKAAVLAVSVPPKRLVEVAALAVRPPLKDRRVEVALEGNGYPKMLAEVR